MSLHKLHQLQILEIQWQTFYRRTIISMEKITVVGADGTIDNTGSKGGVIRRLELQTGQPV